MFMHLPSCTLIDDQADRTGDCHATANSPHLVPAMRPLARFSPTFPTLVAFALIPVFAAAAPLRWEATEIAVDAPPLAESVEATFVFTNTSDRPVTIAEVHSSCGCTVPQLEQRLYAPGESGRIHAVFTIGERIGLQEKAITVTTAQPDVSSTALTLRVTIPTLFELKPYFVIWNLNEPPTARSIQLRLLAPEVLGLGSVTSRHANFEANVAPAGAPDTLTISVTPASTAQATNGGIEIVLQTPDGRTRPTTIYAMIREARNLPPAAPAPASSRPQPALPPASK